MTTALLADSHLPVTETDVVRLFVEFAEVANATEQPRLVLISLFRKVMHAGLHAVSEANQTISFREVARLSLQAREHRRPSTKADLRSYIYRFLSYASWVDNNIQNITSADCKDLLEQHFSTSAHVFSKAKAILNSIFAFAIKHGWRKENPIRSISLKIIREEEINILNLRQVNAIMKAMESPDLRCMQAAVRLMLWCGIRPGEVQRLRWRDVNFSEQEVYIDSLASKTGGARAVPLRGAAAEMKHFRKRHQDFIAPKNWARLWSKLRRRAGFRHWQKDALRHTFASMHLKCYHNINLLQEEMGHRDCHLLRTRYLNLRDISGRTARTFFQWHKGHAAE